MTDRQLLELAAKAAGMFVLPKVWPEVDGWFFCEFHGKPAMHFRQVGDKRHSSSNPWMPLHDDGDALRLAVKLNLAFQVLPGPHAVEAWHNDNSAKEYYGSHDKEAATRRAIVRAAAQIGEKL